MAIVINGTGLTLEKLVRIARHGEQVELSPAAEERIRFCRGMITRKLEKKEIRKGFSM